MKNQLIHKKLKIQITTQIIIISKNLSIHFLI